MFGTIWWAMIIPIIATIYLMVWHKKATTWWELVGLWVASILLIIIGQTTVEFIGKQDTEYWGHLATRAVHNEPYSYWGTCSETYACGQT